MKYRNLLLRLAPALVGLAAFGLMAVLYRLNLVLYLKILYFVGINPWHYPFIDGAYMFAMKDCWQRGVDVYQAVPCDVTGPGGKMAYSPLWQRLPFLPSTYAARVPVGVTTDLLLLLSLPLLPPARTWGEAVLLSLATVSTMVVFALERNNIDVWMYLLIFAGVWLFGRSGASRAVAYAAFLAAGLLKYYPLLAFGLALRERPARFLLIAAISAAALMIFVAAFWADLREALPNVPTASPFGDFVGIVNLPRGFLELGAGDDDLAAGHSRTALALRIGLTVMLLAIAARLARHPGLGTAFGTMPRAEADWLVAGSLIMGGCYLLAHNNGYRGIYLLIVLSGLLALRRRCDDRGLRLMLTAAALSIVPIMWMEALRRWAFHGLEHAPLSPFARVMPVFFLWLTRELLWLNLERVMLAVLLVFALRSATAGAVWTWMRGAATRPEAEPL